MLFKFFCGRLKVAKLKKVCILFEINFKFFIQFVVGLISSFFLNHHKWSFTTIEIIFYLNIERKIIIIGIIKIQSLKREEYFFSLLNIVYDI